MDETSIQRHVSNLRGLVVPTVSGQRVPKDAASLSDRRTCISYLACVTHDVAVQDRLPQVLLGNEHHFTRQLLASVAGLLPANVHVWRQKSSWNSHSTMRKWLSLLARALGPLVQQRYVMLLLDVHPSHIHATIFQHARRCGIRLVYIPAKMTAFLQPLDTHIFAMFKLAYRKAWRETKSTAAAGRVSGAAWLQAIVRAIQSTMARAGVQRAFLAVGALEQQRHVSQQLVADLDLQLPLPRECPTAEALTCIFPARTKLDVMSYALWQPKSQQARRAQTGPAAPAARRTSSQEPEHPPLRRRVLPASFNAPTGQKRIRVLN